MVETVPVFLTLICGLNKTARQIKSFIRLVTEEVWLVPNVQG